MSVPVGSRVFRTPVQLVRVMRTRLDSQFSILDVAIQTRQILRVFATRSLGPLPRAAHESFIERLDEVIVLHTAARAPCQSAAVAEVGRCFPGRAGDPAAQNDGRSTAAAAGTPGRTARRAGEHVVRVHRSEYQALPGRPAGPAEPAPDRVAIETSPPRPVCGEGAEAGEADGVKVQHAAVVDDRDRRV